MSQEAALSLGAVIALLAFMAALLAVTVILDRRTNRK